jgi:hypothetical protein
MRDVKVGRKGDERLFRTTVVLSDV